MKVTGGWSGRPHRCVTQRGTPRLRSILMLEVQRSRSHHPLSCLHKLLISVLGGWPADGPRFYTSSLQTGSRSLELCAQAQCAVILYITDRIKQKPLTIYFLRKAHGLCKISPEKSLSPSFWDAEGIEMQASSRLDRILPGLDHALGTLTWIRCRTKTDV